VDNALASSHEHPTHGGQRRAHVRGGAVDGLEHAGSTRVHAHGGGGLVHRVVHDSQLHHRARHRRSAGSLRGLSLHQCLLHTVKPSLRLSACQPPTTLTDARR
jgi:hypothetical protein